MNNPISSDAISDILLNDYNPLGPVKPDGLTKKVDHTFYQFLSLRSYPSPCPQTISIKINGVDHHVIAYYNEEDVQSNRLQRPTTLPTILALRIPPELVRLTDFRQPPRIEAGTDGQYHV